MTPCRRRRPPRTRPATATLDRALPIVDPPRHRSCCPPRPPRRHARCGAAHPPAPPPATQQQPPRRGPDRRQWERGTGEESLGQFISSILGVEDLASLARLEIGAGKELAFSEKLMGRTRSDKLVFGAVENVFLQHLNKFRAEYFETNFNRLTTTTDLVNVLMKTNLWQMTLNEANP